MTPFNSGTLLSQGMDIARGPASFDPNSTHGRETLPACAVDPRDNVCFSTHHLVTLYLLHFSPLLHREIWVDRDTAPRPCNLIPN